MGHRGIAVAHYTFDRACFSAMRRLLEAHHELLAGSFVGGGSPAHLALQEWEVFTGCALHDAHNSLKWSLHGHFRDAELMKDVFITIAPLRNSFDLILPFLPAWLVEHLEFAGENDLAT